MNTLSIIMTLAHKTNAKASCSGAAAKSSLISTVRPFQQMSLFTEIKARVYLSGLLHSEYLLVVP